MTSSTDRAGGTDHVLPVPESAPGFGPPVPGAASGTLEPPVRSRATAADSGSGDCGTPSRVGREGEAAPGPGMPGAARTSAPDLRGSGAEREQPGGTTPAAGLTPAQSPSGTGSGAAATVPGGTTSSSGESFPARLKATQSPGQGTPALRLLSLGAGVQSTTLLLMSAYGDLPKLDAAIFSDTGWEPDAVYEHLDRLEAEVAQPAGIPVYRVAKGNLRDDLLNPDKMAMIPAYTLGPDGERGMLKRKCTERYKLDPIRKQTRLLLGAPQHDPEPCRYCQGGGRRVAPWRAKRGDHTAGQCSVCGGTGVIARIGRVPAGRVAEQWVGFSTDEITRVSGHTDTRYVRSRYPLLELNMSRTQCETYLKHHGWKSVAKSACIGCTYHGNRFWRNMRDERPAEFAAAVAFDKAYRDGPGMRSQRFLHISCKPLDEAPLDRWQRTDIVQTDIFDAVYEARMEDGDPDGCSPHGCRSGEAVA